MTESVSFKDILIPGRSRCGIFNHMTRSWHPKYTMTLDKLYSPQNIKDLVANSTFIDAIIEAESSRLGVRKGKLKQEVLGYLEEIGMDKKMHVIRWMGVIFLKISFMMKIEVFVNEPAIWKVRESMGSNPVLFLPTHRSYADFCLITYLCYNFDIDFPAVAAGMDFYSMAVLGRRMRETCAFYIRRTLAGAPLYAATLKHYVRTLVAKHSAPIEFFLEGTRSRSNKSLAPKYGMLSMSLMPLFSREVSDITVVPFNISYDRLMEHGLFAYEHLGVPKPKEATGTLLKSLHILNDHFGNIYINAGEPISLRDYFKLGTGTDATDECLKPTDLQQLTTEQFKQVQDLANYVVSKQQENTVASISNLISLVMMQSVMKQQLLRLEDVYEEVAWMTTTLRGLGASVFVNDVKSNVEKILKVHHKMITVDKAGKLRLVSSALMDVDSEVQNKMKGHILKAETMVNAVPIIQLQLYVNPLLHYLVPPALACLLVKRAPLTKEQLAAEYYYIRTLLKHEFFYLDKDEEKIFDRALDYSFKEDVISSSGDLLVLGKNVRVGYLLEWAAWPALTTLLRCIEIMQEQTSCEHTKAMKLIQERVESTECHPYCLSLDAIANCLQGLVLAGALDRDKLEQQLVYIIVPETLSQCCRLVQSLIPTLDADFGRTNSVILDHRLPSRL